MFIPLYKLFPYLSAICQFRLSPLLATTVEWTTFYFDLIGLLLNEETTSGYPSCELIQHCY